MLTACILQLMNELFLHGNGVRTVSDHLVMRTLRYFFHVEWKTNAAVSYLVTLNQVEPIPCGGKGLYVMGSLSLEGSPMINWLWGKEQNQNRLRRP